MLYLVTNISSKTKPGIGTPYLKIDGSPCEIYRDCIERNVSGTHTITAGYGNIENLRQQIYIDDSDNWYQYNVPLMKHGTGRLIKISKFKYKSLKCLRNFYHAITENTVLAIIMLIFLIIASTVLKVIGLL